MYDIAQLMVGTLKCLAVTSALLGGFYLVMQLV
jgi:hypothetical protein